MDPERTLLSRVAQTGEVQELVALGIRDDHFADQTGRDAFRFMVEHAAKHGKAPSFPLIKQEFEDYDFPLVQDATSWCVDRFVDGLKRRKTRESLEAIAEATDDPAQVGSLDQLFAEESRKLMTWLPSIVRVERMSDMEKRIEEYDRALGVGDLKGISMGIPKIDDLTWGIQPHEFVTISGWQGVGKSTLTQHVLHEAFSSGKTPMYISLEMDARALFRKWDAMTTHFKYRHLKHGTLTDKEREDWEKAAERAKKGPGDIIVIDEVVGCTVDRVASEIHKHGPDLVAIDYITLMDTPRSAGDSTWEQVRYLSRNLKQIARTMGVPIIGVAQTNADDGGSGATLRNIAYGRSIGMDSDIVLGLHQTDEMRENNQMVVRLNKNRDGARGEQAMRWELDSMTIREWKTTDAFVAAATAPHQKGRS